MKQCIITRDVDIKETEKENSKVIGQAAEKELVEFIELKGTKVLIKTSSGIEGYIPKSARRNHDVPVVEEVIDPKIKNKQIMQQDKRTKELAEKAKRDKKQLESEKFKRVTYYVDKETLFKLAQLYDFQDEDVTKKDFINRLLSEAVDSYKAKGFEFEEFDPDNKKHIKRI